MAKKKKNHYVDNKQLLQSLTEYRQKIADAEVQGKTKPRIPEFAAKCFMLIAEHYARDRRFARYTFKEDMILDAIENCVRAASAFNPEESPYAVSYFSKVIFNSFLRTIKDEKIELAAKYKYAMHIGYTKEVESMDVDGNPTVQFEMYDNIAEFIDRFDKSEAEKKIKIKEKKLIKDMETKRNLENFVEE